MTDNSELQSEEREALLSIYDGDNSFKQVDSTTYQYKYGESDTLKSFLLELKWGENYPDALPQINMDTFYNKHIIPALKQKIVQLVTTEAEQFLGMSMTYSLFELIKEKFDELINEQPEDLNVQLEDKLCITEDEPKQQDEVKKEKKEQLTKAQKRRQWSRLDGKGEKPRGWNWVDLVKHLSQTGSKEDTPLS